MKARMRQTTGNAKKGGESPARRSRMLAREIDPATDPWKGKRGVTGPRVDWERAKFLFVTTSMARADIAQSVGCATETLALKIRAEAWVEAREEHRASAAEASYEQARREHLAEVANAIRQVWGLKMQVAQRLKERLTRDTYKVSAKDLDILQRLELDLLGVGKKTNDGIDVRVSVESRVEVMLAKLEEQREAALRTINVEGETVSPAAFPSAIARDPVDAFFFGDSERTEDDE